MKEAVTIFHSPGIDDKDDIRSHHKVAQQVHGKKGEKENMRSDIYNNHSISIHLCLRQP